jgi:spoIIIJ-associated protein
VTESTTSDADRPEAQLPGAPAVQATFTAAPTPSATTSGVGPLDAPPEDGADDEAAADEAAAVELETPADDVGARSGSGSDAVDPTADPDQPDLSRLEQEGDIAADYLEELLDIADLDGDLDMDVEGDRAAVSIVGGDVRQLVGRDGEVLEALQELTRLAVYRETGERSRLMLDVGGFRADKRSRLEKLASEAVAEVQQTGAPKSLTPMSPFERKVVHDAVAAAGLSSASEGTEPRRYVVVLPA